MKWFKHYSDASKSRVINHLMDEFGPQGYAWFFLLLELCAEKWDGKSRPVFVFHTRVIRQKLRISLVKLELFLNICQVKGQLLFNFSKKEVQISIPKLAEIKSSRSVTKNSYPPIKSKIKNKEEDRECRSIPLTPDVLCQLFFDTTGRKTVGTIAGSIFDEYRQTCGFKPFDSAQGWKDLFFCFESSTFLKESSLGIAWLVVYKNAFKVLNGEFADKKKTNPDEDKWAQLEKTGSIDEQ